MSYILGTYLNPAKQVRIALRAIFGIGKHKSSQICYQLGLSDTIKVNQLTRIQLENIIKIISQQYLIDSELRRIIHNDIKRLISVGSYRGFRHISGLPLRGQRTHSNANTCRKARQIFKRPTTKRSAKQVKSTRK